MDRQLTEAEQDIITMIAAESADLKRQLPSSRTESVERTNRLVDLLQKIQAVNRRDTGRPN